jgi:malonyl-CoA/methylmalonyl-CoA synthetase
LAHIFAAEQRTAIVDDQEIFTYWDIWATAQSVRNVLLQDSADLLEQRIAFLVPAGFDYVATLFGIWAAGGIAVPLCLKHPLPELQYVLSDTGARQLVVAREFADVANSLAECHTVQVLFTDLVNTETDSDRISSISWSDHENTRAMILYTSGSTGRPKGVVTTHTNIAAQVDALIEAWQWSPDDRILHVLPLHHVHGIINVLLCAMRVGAVCEFAHPFQAEATWERIGGGELTLFMAVPTIYAKLVTAFDQATAEQRQRWSEAAGRMRLHVSGSAALPVPILEKWESMTGQRLLERYGMTEIGMALSNPYRGDRRPGFVGRPLSGVDVRRLSESGTEVADHEPGEIEVRGPNVFSEYWNRPQETAASFHDGWFRTGDIAVVENGDFRILGRSSVDIIKTGGYKVSALEIEDVLRTHPSIRDCAVVGIADDQWGERVAVCAVCVGTLDLETLRQWGKQQLASYKVPTLLCLRDELPRNAMGKVQKRFVQQLFDPHS